MPQAKRSMNVPSHIKLTAEAGAGVDWIEAAASDSAGTKLRTFTMVAYSGGPMDVGFGYPVVVDLAGMTVSDKPRPIFRDHDPGKVVGHTTSVDVKAKSIKVSGVISGTNEHAEDVLTAADNGFPWQASIGAKIKKMEFAEKGETIEANGRKFAGPVYVARESVLGEVSFVALGADDNTSATVIAATRFRANTCSGSENMLFKEWLAAKGITDADKVDAAVMKVLEATYEEEVTKPEIKASSGFDQDAIDKYIEAKSASAAVSHYERLGAIQDIASDFPKLAASAIKDSWSIDKLRAEVNGAKLEQLRASRAENPGHLGNPAGCDALVLEAALCINRKQVDVEKQFKEATLDAAHKQFKGRLTLKQMLMITAAANGMQLQAGDSVNDGNLREFLAYACPDRRNLRAAATAISLPGILGNVANKEILQGYVEVDSVWRMIAQTKSVNDFKTVTSYRMLDDFSYEKLGPGGRIKHGRVSEESFTRSVDTYAKMGELTRQDIINDDLSALDQMRSSIGRGGALALNDLFWTTFLGNLATIFTATRTNYIAGSTTNLGTDGVGLGLGQKAWRTRTSPVADGSKRISTTAKFLLVPPELETIAEALFVARNPGAVKVSDVNTFAGKYMPIVAPQLSDSTITGYSTTAWYLLGDKAEGSPIVVSFLNGNESPTIESADADFNTLGIQFRGYHDFGCDLGDGYLNALMVKGAA